MLRLIDIETFSKIAIIASLFISDFEVIEFECSCRFIGSIIVRFLGANAAFGTFRQMIQLDFQWKLQHFQLDC